jgi:uncharacterized protein (DUF1330 family)
MTTFVLVHGTVKDPQQLAAYSEAAAPTIADHGGAIGRKGKAHGFVGDHAHSLTAVIQFPDNETAKTWYASPAYQALVPMRDKAMDCVFVMPE